MSNKGNCVKLFKGDEGRPTFALSKLHWGAFRDANEKQQKILQRHMEDFY